MSAPTFDQFEPERSSRLMSILLWAIGALLVVAFAWYVYHQLTAVRGVSITEDPKSMVDVVPLPPPPPPPPPPPEPKEKPPEPTEQPQPSPVEAPKTPQQQAAPVSINAPAQAGTDSYGLRAGNGGGIGAPGGGGTCLGTNCGAAAGGGGMSEAFYRRYLSSALQERVQDDEKLSRLVFSADFTLNVTPDGRVTGVQFLSGRGRSDDETMKKLAAILAAVRGLNPPPAAMEFPQKVTVRGRRAY
ncbi:MAG: TonB-dependent receptor [Sphingobium sp.]|nr:TonB-dependent receptor [Sphingobium sp.]